MPFTVSSTTSMPIQNPLIGPRTPTKSSPPSNEDWPLVRAQAPRLCG